MRSFRLAWGLGGKIARMRDWTRRVSRDNMPYDATVVWHLSMNGYQTIKYYCYGNNVFILCSSIVHYQLNR